MLSTTFATVTWNVPSEQSSLQYNAFICETMLNQRQGFCTFTR